MRKLLLTIILATTAAAQNPEDYDRYLVPVIQRDLRGANGSVWTAELLFRNRSSRDMNLIGPFPALLCPACDPSLVPAKTTVDLLLIARGDGADGVFLYVPKSSSEPKPAITLHVRDTSKNATAFGTEIHLPPPDEFQQAIDLIGVPTDDRYRATLRIYSTGAAPQKARVTTYAADDRMLDQQEVVLSGIVNIVFDPFPKHPAYFQLDPLPAAVRASGDRVRVVVDVPGDPVPIWAFVTVTDNVTQLTSTITPNR